jgi:hypothetical protein
MIYPNLSILGIEEVRRLSDPRVDYLLSILAIDDLLDRPGWVTADHYVSLVFDDLDDPDFQDGVHIPPLSPPSKTSSLGAGKFNKPSA